MTCTVLSATPAPEPDPAPPAPPAARRRVPPALAALAACVLATVALVAAAPTASAASFSRVVIDPGHGGHDRGANRSYYFEKHLALDVAFRLERYLKARGLRSTLTRRRDTFIPLDDRAALANRTSGSIFVSIHFNSAYNTKATGIETFYYRSGESLQLAQEVQNSMIRSTRVINRGVKRASFVVLRENRRPAVLVECGFMSNSSERRKCLDPAYRQRLAEAIGQGILAYRKR